MGKAKHRSKITVGYLVMAVVGVIMLVPMLWMVGTSLKDGTEVYALPPTWIPTTFHWDNYHTALTMYPFLRYALNTTIVTTCTLFAGLMCTAMAAYAFARIKFWGRDYIFAGYLATMMIPAQVTLVPAFILMRMLGFIDSLKALIVPGLWGGAFGTFLLRQFFMGIPNDLSDCAMLDGAGHFRILTRIFIPLAKPALATLGLLGFINTWNDFMWPLIVINSVDKRTLTLGLSVFRGLYTVQNNYLMAATLASLVPIFILLAVLQKYYVQGITLTGIK